MKRFSNILFVSVPEVDDHATVERAAALAQDNQAALTLVEVVERLPAELKLPGDDLSVGGLQGDLTRAAMLRLEELAEPWHDHAQIQYKVLIGTPFLEIIREVLREGRDLVIKAADSGGLFDRLFGSDDMHLLRKCPCPVWLDRPGRPRPYRRILAAVDVADADPRHRERRLALARQIVEMASSLALAEFAELHLVHAWEAVGESALRSGRSMLPAADVDQHVERIRLGRAQFLDSLVRHLHANTAGYLKPTRHLLKGSARTLIPKLATELEADLVVMGTLGRTGISGLLIGNTAETILNRLSCSVLAVKPEGFVSPVRLAG